MTCPQFIMGDHAGVLSSVNAWYFVGVIIDGNVGDVKVEQSLAEPVEANARDRTLRRGSVFGYQGMSTTFTISARGRFVSGTYGIHACGFLRESRFVTGTPTFSPEKVYETPP